MITGERTRTSLPNVTRWCHMTYWYAETVPWSPNNLKILRKQKKMWHEKQKNVGIPLLLHQHFAKY